MPAKKNPAVDAYIAKSAEFAQPILKKLRTLIHKACPDVVETMKWSSPFFDYQGPLIGMPAFKQHVNLVFWKGSLLSDPAKLLAGDKAMMNGCVIQLRSLDDLPADKILLTYFAEAVALNEQGIKVPARKKTPKPPMEMPAGFQSALNKARPAKAAFEALSPSHQREYLEWILDAKQPATRERRIARAIEQLTEAKSLHWKYARKT